MKKKIVIFIILLFTLCSVFAKDGKSFYLPSNRNTVSIAGYGIYSFQYVRFDDGKKMNSHYGIGGKAEVAYKPANHFSIVLSSNIQEIKYHVYDYLEVAGFIKGRLNFYPSKRFSLFMSAGYGQNIVQFFYTTTYPMMSLDAGLDFYPIQHFAISCMAEYNISFQRDSENTHIGLCLGIKTSMGGAKNEK